MSTSFVVLDLALVVALDNHSPTVMNLEFLRLSGIVPQDWELARPPVISQQGSQLIFANGVSMVGQADRVVFLAPMLEGGELADQAALLAQKYVQALSQGDYQAVGVNLRGYASNTDPNWVGQYFSQTLLRPGAWQQIGTEPVRPNVSLNYALGDGLGQLNLNITPAQIQQADQPALDTIFFAANYNQALQGASSERFLQLQGVLATWQRQYQHFGEMVQTQFLTVAGENYDPLLRDAALSAVA
jgi:hypothetical protein